MRKNRTVPFFSRTWFSDCSRIIREEKAKDLPGLINLIGIKSPGLTASPAIARMVAGMVDKL